MQPDAGAFAASTDAVGMPMQLGVYDCAGNAVLFVPVAVQPPLDATAAHGPLLYRGTVLADPSASSLWREILKQIDRHLFVTVGSAEIGLLLGSGLPVAARGDEAPAAV